MVIPSVLPMTESVFYSHSFASDCATSRVAEQFTRLVALTELDPSHASSNNDRKRLLIDWLVAIITPIGATITEGLMNVAIVSTIALTLMATFTSRELGIFIRDGWFAAAGLVAFLFLLRTAFTLPKGMLPQSYAALPRLRRRLFAPLLNRHGDQTLWRHRDTLHAAMLLLAGPTVVIAGLVGYGYAEATPDGYLAGLYASATSPSLGLVAAVYATFLMTATCQLVVACIQVCRVAYVGTNLTRHINRHAIRMTDRVHTLTDERLVYSTSDTNKIIAIITIPDSTFTTLAIRDCFELYLDSAVVLFPGHPLGVATLDNYADGNIPMRASQCNAYTLHFARPLTTETS